MQRRDFLVGSHIWHAITSHNVVSPERMMQITSVITKLAFCFSILFPTNVVKSTHLHIYSQAAGKDTVLSLYGWSFRGLYNSFLHADTYSVSLEIKAEKILRLSNWLICSTKPRCLPRTSKRIQTTVSQSFPAFCDHLPSLPFQHSVCHNCFFSPPFRLIKTIPHPSSLPRN